MKKVWTRPVVLSSTMSMEVTAYSDAELDDELLHSKVNDPRPTVQKPEGRAVWA